MTHERIFLAKYRELLESLGAPGPGSALKRAQLFHRLLLDANPLTHQAKRDHQQLALRFSVSRDLVTDPESICGSEPLDPFVVLAQDSIDPLVFLSARGSYTVGLEDFLQHPVAVFARDTVVTVRQLVKALRNMFDQHGGDPRTDGDRAVKALLDLRPTDLELPGMYQIRDASDDATMEDRIVRTMQAVARLTVRALEPIYEALITQTVEEIEKVFAEADAFEAPIPVAEVGADEYRVLSGIQLAADEAARIAVDPDALVGFQVEGVAFWIATKHERADARQVVIVIGAHKTSDRERTVSAGYVLKTRSAQSAAELADRPTTAFAEFLVRYAVPHQDQHRRVFFVASHRSETTGLTFEAEGYEGQTIVNSFCLKALSGGDFVLAWPFAIALDVYEADLRDRPRSRN